MSRPNEVEPQHHSARRPGTKSYGGRIVLLSEMLGRPAMPWQARGADLLAEYDPATGLRTRGLTVVTVQRQAGKTDLVLETALERMLSAPSQRVWYTAQSGKYARDKWSEMITQLCEPGSPFAGMVAVRWAKGDEAATLPNGSTLCPFPPTRDALHSKQTDLTIVDEAWKHDKVRGDELMQAISPTQATRPGAQTMLLSTMGTAASTWWHSWVDKGRAGHPAVDAYIEYGIGDQADPTDLENVIARHPAVGHTISPEFIRNEAGKMTPSEFARAYGNARTATDERFIDLILWEAGRTKGAPSGRLHLAADVADDQSRTALVVVGDGVGEVIDSRPGMVWAPGRVAELVREHRLGPVAVDPRSGPSRWLYAELERLRVPLAEFHAADYAAGCASTLRRIADGDLHYRRHDDLDRAADAAIPAPVGDGAWQWSRRKSGGPICELVALTLADWQSTHAPAGTKPRFVTASG